MSKIQVGVTVAACGQIENCIAICEIERAAPKICFHQLSSCLVRYESAWWHLPAVLRHVLCRVRQVVQLFDSWAGLLSPAQFAEFSLPYAQRVIDGVRAVHPDTPLIFHANGGALPSSCPAAFALKAAPQPALLRSETSCSRDYLSFSVSATRLWCSSLPGLLLHEWRRPSR